MAAAQADLDEARLEAETNSSQLWNVWSEARNISDSLGSRAAASDKVVAAYDQQFNAGRRSLQDLIAIRDEHQRTQADAQSTTCMRGSSARCRSWPCWAGCARV